MTEIKIPDEYKAFDFGFSGVDEPEREIVERAPEPIIDQEMEDRITGRIEAMHVDVLSAIGALKEKRDVNLTQNEFQNKITALEKIIVPLLNKLIQTADKEYIKWPNRGEECGKMLKHVLSITRP